jgi:hypothetical protein
MDLNNLAALYDVSRLGCTQPRFSPAAAWYFSSFVGSFSPGGRKRTYKGDESVVYVYARMKKWDNEFLNS